MENWNWKVRCGCLLMICVIIDVLHHWFQWFAFVVQFSFQLVAVLADQMETPPSVTTGTIQEIKRKTKWPFNILAFWWQVVSCFSLQIWMCLLLNWKNGLFDENDDTNQSNRILTAHINKTEVSNCTFCNYRKFVSWTSSNYNNNDD